MKDTPIEYAIDTHDQPPSYDPNSLFTKSGTTLTFANPRGEPRIAKLTSKNPYHERIYQGILAGLTSRWFFFEIDDRTKTCYYYSVQKIIDWMNLDIGRNEMNRYQCLTDFEIFERNDRKLKHSNSTRIKTLLSQTSEFKQLNPSDSLYIESLIKFTKRTYLTEYESNSLTDWFDMPWLKQVIGESKYLQLESPQRLILSFRVIVATTLQYLLDMRKEWFERPQLTMDLARVGWYQQWNSALIKSIGRFDILGRPSDELTRLAMLDCVNPQLEEFLLDRIRYKSLQNIGKLTGLNGASIKVWRKPRFFLPPEKNIVSPTEERLAAWLAAAEAISPSGVKELKTTNYTAEYSGADNQRLKIMQSQYHKGRSGKFARPDLLLGKYCWTIAMHDYIQQIPTGKMFKTDVQVPPPLYSDWESNSFFSFLCRLWKLPEVSDRIDREIARHSASSLFMSAMLALQNGSDALSTLKNRSPMSRADYERKVERPIPDSLFSLGQIKTSAVHADSDEYRDSDLVNHNSHTSLTEKISYLTDANKDYVNRFQRITRVVFNDLLNVVFQPSIDKVRREVLDRQSRTRIVKATGKNGSQVLQIRYDSQEQKYGDKEIVVVDCVDTAIFFIHYTTQAEIYCEELAKANPVFVERTLLPTVEWMERVLMRMTSAKKAVKQYEKLKRYLPPEFAHILAAS